MFMRSNNSGLCRFVLLALLCVAPLVAQENGAAAAARYLAFDFPAASPLRLVDTDWGRSRILQRGSAATAELHLVLKLENRASQPIHGITLLFVTQAFAPGGKASITLPGLRVAPGEVFPAKVDLRLLQPIAAGGQPRVTVSLDGVLFEDLSFAGDNTLNSQRLLSGLELEIQQDRRHARELLRSGGKEALGREMRQILARREQTPRVEMQWARRGRATNAPASEPVRFAFLHTPDSPLRPLDASVRIAANEAIEPTIRVQNRSGREIRYAEIGWIIRDLNGREFYAGTLPASDGNIELKPTGETVVRQQGVLRFSERQNVGGQLQDVPVRLGEMVGFVSQVQFADGSLWMPNRYQASTPSAIRMLRLSPEQQRLASLYAREGLDALVNDLRK
ncbi:MAG: hypothetical protein U5J83_05850 [Bryobacterales bacterium]|nr:hypothetical protein [Bryobacterales bacterium]